MYLHTQTYHGDVQTPSPWWWNTKRHRDIPALPTHTSPGRCSPRSACTITHLHFFQSSSSAASPISLLMPFFSSPSPLPPLPWKQQCWPPSVVQTFVGNFPRNFKEQQILHGQVFILPLRKPIQRCHGQGSCQWHFLQPSSAHHTGHSSQQRSRSRGSALQFWLEQPARVLGSQEKIIQIAGS